jgi:hypothetical protein
MDQSQLSKIIAILKIAYPYYFKDLTVEETVAMVSLYKSQINYDYKTTSSAVTELIKIKKYMPSIAEIIDECKNQQLNKKYLILELMKNDGYFKTDWEYEKAESFIKKSIIPSWLKEDMKKYIPQIENQKLLKV